MGARAAIEEVRADVRVGVSLNPESALGFAMKR